MMRSSLRSIPLLFGALACIASIQAESELNAYAPELNLTDTDGNTVEEYRGFVVDDEDIVALDPILRASDKDEIGGARFICGYRIYPDPDKDYDIPFEAEVKNHFNGEARLVVKAQAELKKSSRNKYKFQIAAFDCGNPTLHSIKAHVVITVLHSDVLDKEDLIGGTENLKSPPIPEPTQALKEKTPPTPDIGPPAPPTEFERTDFFERSSYIVAIREATLYDSILHLRPKNDKDQDNICGYQIISPGIPFAVDSQGNIKNTKALDHAHQTSYILSVVAKHCNGLASKPVMINVQVSQLCMNGWRELPKSLDYSAGTKAIFPFTDTYFDTCSMTCDRSEQLDVTVSLDSKGEINTCQHDTYSIASQRKICGASEDTVDLLPKGKVWTEALEKLDSKDSAYKFTGKTAISVPSEHSNHTLTEHFGIGFWMRHGMEKKDGHKEHILCNSDGEQMNRHHYSLFVHNCRLVFLLRKEASQVDDLNQFQPAEWRWSIPHVCDDQWHYYTVSVDFPKVKLHVDGQGIQEKTDILEVVDDWALHPTNKIHFDQLTVGACWQGATSDYGQYFDGYLAGVTLLTGTTETERVIKCMNNCGEKLQFHAMDLLENGMSVSFNTELTEITIRGSDSSEVKRLLRKIGYANTNGDPKPGIRRLHIHTNTTCNEKVLDVNEQAIIVSVSAVVDPQIHIEGVSYKERRAEEFRHGVDIFTEVMIVSQPEELKKKQENRVNKLDVEDISILQRDLKKTLLLDRCEVRVSPPMKLGVEHLDLPVELLIKYLLDTKEFTDGFDITGSESFTNYENVLREVFYFNSAVDDSFKAKTFTVKCYNMNGKFQSNIFSAQLGIIHGVQEAFNAFADFDHAKEAVVSLTEQEARFNKGHVSKAASTTSPVMIAVVVVCVIALVAIIAVAGVRIRSANIRRNENPNVHVEDGPQMEWDDTTLNITVNPLETDTLMREAKDEDSDSEVDDGDLVNSEDEEEGAFKSRELEWDNSTLNY